MKILSVLLFSLSLVAECEVPQNITLVTHLDRCALWQKVQVEWKEANGRRWMLAWMNDQPFKESKIEDVSLVVHEMPKFFLVGELWVDGAFFPFEKPEVWFSSWDGPDHRILLHEFVHAQMWMDGQKQGWDVVGHGVAEDPYVKSVNTLIQWLYPVPRTNPAFPGLLPMPPAVRSQEVMNCAISSTHR